MTPLQLLALVVCFVIARVLFDLPVLRGIVAREKAHIGGEPATIVIREYLDAFIVAGLVALFLITFVVRTFFIPSGSMEPTLQIHDVLLVNEFEYRFGEPHESDIVVFRPPIPASSDFIKRVIGLPGDRLRIQDGVIYRNGAALNEPYIAQRPAYDLEVRDYGIFVDGVRLSPTAANIPPKQRWVAPDRIPPGCYLLFGDNRNDSEDSHIWGFAQTKGLFATGPLRGTAAEFTGHAFFLFWPPNRIHQLK